MKRRWYTLAVGLSALGFSIYAAVSPAQAQPPVPVPGNSVCASNGDLGVAGNLQVEYIRAWT